MWRRAMPAGLKTSDARGVEDYGVWDQTKWALDNLTIVYISGARV